MTSSMRKSSDQKLCCRPDTVKFSHHNPAEVICIKCHSRFPCEHFGIKPNIQQSRSKFEVVTLPAPSELEPECVLEVYDPDTNVSKPNTKCGGQIVFSHQGWIFNSQCDRCGQSYLNLTTRVVYQNLELITSF